MTSFVKLRNGNLIRVDAIKAIREWSKDGMFRAVHGDDDQLIGWVDVGSLAKATGTVIPAAPGWRVCYVSDSEQFSEHFFRGIVAWRIDDDDSVSPITAEEAVANPRVIVSPGGQCFDFTNSWDTFEQAIASLRELAADRKKRAAAREAAK